LQKKLKKRRKIVRKKRNRESEAKSNRVQSTIKGDLNHAYFLLRVGIGGRRYKKYQQSLL